MGIADSVARDSGGAQFVKDVAAMLARSKIDPAEVTAEKIRRGTYQVATKVKQEDGSEVVEIHDLKADSVVLAPTWEAGPEWPVVQQAAPVSVRSTVAKRRTVKGWQTCVVLPDTQIGFRRYDDGTLDPFHDETAISCALAVLREVRPDKVVLLGDFMDLPEFGTYEQEAAFALTTQPTVDRAHALLCEIQACAPEADVVLLEGNHDRRIQKAITRNAVSAFGLKRAAEPDGWPVMSVPHLLRLDELGVEYVDGYPAGIHWINDNLACIHGSTTRSRGSTAKVVVDDERVSVIFGHVHRIERHHKTRRTRDGAKSSAAISPGCLCRIDGAVPSTKGSTDSKGKPVNATEDWQQGIAVVHHEPGDGRFAVDLVAIHDGWCMFGGREYQAG